MKKNKVIHTYGLDEEIIKVPRFEESEGFYSTEKSSRLMRRIKAKNNKLEVSLRKMLYRAGLRFRIHHPHLPGRPDIALTKYKIAIFIDGEFWHGYNWGTKKWQIKSNRAFWIAKIERNIQRDRINNQKLKSQGWAVIRFWGHEAANTGYCLKIILRQIAELSQDSSTF